LTYWGCGTDPSTLVRKSFPGLAHWWTRNNRARGGEVTLLELIEECSCLDSGDFLGQCPLKPSTFFFTSLLSLQVLEGPWALS
jgi:hypothetical protein